MQIKTSYRTSRTSLLSQANIESVSKNLPQNSKAILESANEHRNKSSHC